MQITHDENSGVLKISGDAAINAVEELRRALCELVRTAPTPVVDVSEVSRCDTAVLQLFCSARKTAEHQRKSFEVLRLSSGILEVTAALGLSQADYSTRPLGTLPEDIARADQNRRGPEHAL
jgi:ABC-type transporter Mla MlaB component